MHNKRAKIGWKKEKVISNNTIQYNIEGTLREKKKGKDVKLKHSPHLRHLY